MTKEDGNLNKKVPSRQRYHDHTHTLDTSNQDALATQQNTTPWPHEITNTAFFDVVATDKHATENGCGDANLTDELWLSSRQRCVDAVLALALLGLVDPCHDHHNVRRLGSRNRRCDLRRIGRPRNAVWSGRQRAGRRLRVVSHSLTDATVVIVNSLIKLAVAVIRSVH